MSPSDTVPPEVLAIAVALATVWSESAAAEVARPVEPSRWRWGGRRWERPANHRWS